MTPRTRLDPPEVRLGRRRHWVVTHAQLLEAGLTDEAILHRVRTGRLHRIHKGVYAVGRADLTREGRWLAAVLACCAGAALSHRPAGLHWGVLERGDERPHVVVPTQSGHRMPRGVRVHRSDTIRPEDVVVRLGIPTTSLPRTLVDLAGVLDRRGLKSAVRQAERSCGLDLHHLRRFVDEPVTDFRKARLRKLLDLYVPSRGGSVLEAAFMELCARHDVPMPDEQQKLGPYRTDFVWHGATLIVETDGRETHETVIASVDDRIRDRALMAAGYEVHHYAYAEVVRTPAAVAREVRAAIMRRTTEGPVASAGP